MMEVNKEIVDKRTQLAVERIAQWGSYVEVSARLPASLSCWRTWPTRGALVRVSIFVSGPWFSWA